MANTNTAQTSTANTLGNVLELPSIGVKHIDLSKFRRVGLEQLNEWSCVRDNRSIKTVSPQYMHRIHADAKYTKDRKNPVCAVCGRTLRECAGIGPKVSEFTINDKYSMIVFGHNRQEIYACRDCAAKPDFRDAIVQKLPKTHAGTVAADGIDVYGFVATIFAQGQADARLLPHTVTFRPHPSLMVKTTETVNGKVLTIGNAPQVLGWAAQTLILRGDAQKATVENQKVRERTRAQKLSDRLAKQKKGNKVK